jgi:Ras-related protein Rab-21
MTDDLVVHVVGNKLDLESSRQVSLSSVLDYCDRVNNNVSGIHEVSAKENNGIEDVFYEITQILVKKKFGQDLYRTTTTDIYNRDDTCNTSEKSGCC